MGNKARVCKLFGHRWEPFVEAPTDRVGSGLYVRCRRCGREIRNRDLIHLPNPPFLEPLDDEQ